MVTRTRGARRHAGGMAVMAMTLCLGAGTVAAQEPPPPPTTPEAVKTPDPAPLPPSLDLDAFREAVARDPAVKLDDQRLRFYLEIVARRPSFSDFLGSESLLYGPVARAPITHQEFVQMVTPKEVYGAGGIRAGEILQMTLSGLLAKALVTKALKAFRGASDDEELAAIRARIDRELRLLENGGKD